MTLRRVPVFQYEQLSALPAPGQASFLEQPVREKGQVLAAVDTCAGYDAADPSELCAAVASEGGTSAHRAHDQYY
jgi:hypothetical protein